MFRGLGNGMVAHEKDFFAQLTAAWCPYLQGGLEHLPYERLHQ